MISNGHHFKLYCGHFLGNSEEKVLECWTCSYPHAGQLASGHAQNTWEDKKLCSCYNILLKSNLSVDKEPS